MVPGIYNFKTQKANDTFNGLRFTCTLTSDGSTDPIDLSGFEIRMQVRKSIDCPVILELTNSDVDTGISIEDALNGIFRIDEFVVPNVGSFSYKYDIEFKYPSGVVKTYIKGNFPIEEDVTK